MSYSDIFSHIVIYLEPCVTLSYLEPCYIQNPSTSTENNIYYLQNIQFCSSKDM